MQWNNNIKEGKLNELDDICDECQDQEEADKKTLIITGLKI